MKQRFFMKKIYILIILFCNLCCSKQNDVFVQKIYKNSATIINGGDNSISVLDLKTLQIAEPSYINNINEAFAHHIYFSNDFKNLSVALPDHDFSLGHSGLHETKLGGKIGLFNYKTGNLDKIINIAAVNHDAIISPNGKEIWNTIYGKSSTLKIYDIESEKLIREISIGEDPTELIFGLNNKYAAVASSEGSFLTIIDLITKNIVKDIKVDPYPSSVYAGKDNASVFVVNDVANSLNIVDLNQLKVVDFIDFKFKPGFIGYNAIHDEVWVCVNNGNKIYVYKKEGDIWQQKQTLNSNNDPHQITFFDGGLKAAVINQNSNTVQIFNTNNYSLIKTLKTGKKPNGIAIWE
jgi:YVTN family beta-propeller protein